MLVSLAFDEPVELTTVVEHEERHIFHSSSRCGEEVSAELEAWTQAFVLMSLTGVSTDASTKAARFWPPVIWGRWRSLLRSVLQFLAYS